jgi:hypothetical protein
MKNLNPNIMLVSITLLVVGLFGVYRFSPQGETQGGRQVATVNLKNTIGNRADQIRLCGFYTGLRNSIAYDYENGTLSAETVSDLLQVQRKTIRRATGEASYWSDTYPELNEALEPIMAKITRDDTRLTERVIKDYLAALDTIIRGLK